MSPKMKPDSTFRPDHKSQVDTISIYDGVETSREWKQTPIKSNNIQMKFEAGK